MDEYTIARVRIVGAIVFRENLISALRKTRTRWNTTRTLRFRGGEKQETLERHGTFLSLFLSLALYYAGRLMSQTERILIFLLILRGISNTGVGY